MNPYVSTSNEMRYPMHKIASFGTIKPLFRSLNYKKEKRRQIIHKGSNNRNRVGM